MRHFASLYNIVKGKQKNESTQAILARLIVKAEVLSNIEAEATRQAEIYALGVKRMAEQRAVYE